MRRNIITLFMLLFAAVGVVSAAEFLQNSECVVESDEVIEDNLYVLCRDLLIEGEVRGHLIGAAVTATINGKIGNNIYLVAGQLDLSGELGGDIHFAGVTLNVLPETEFNNTDIVNLALSNNIQADVSVPGSIVMLGYQLLVSGEVQSEIDFWGSSLWIDGHVQGDVNASVGDANATGTASQVETLLLPFNFDVDLIDPGLTVTENGSVDGLLTYTALSEGSIAGELEQEPIYKAIDPGPTLIDLVEEEDPGGALQNYLGQVTREFTSLIVIGVLALLVVPQVLRLPMISLRQQPLSSLGVGVLSFVISFPIVLILVLLSMLIMFILALLRLDGLLAVIGLLLGIIDFGTASVFYFMAIFLSRVVLALTMGRLFARIILKNPNTTFAWILSLTIGTALLALFASLPLIGWMFNAMALFLGLGAILVTILTQIRQLRETTAAPAPVYYGADTVVLTPTPHFPPPILEDQPRGMDNLPDGFKWWDD